MAQLDELRFEAGAELVEESVERPVGDDSDVEAIDVAQQRDTDALLFEEGQAVRLDAARAELVPS